MFAPLNQFVEKTKIYIIENALIDKDDKILLSLSAGKDSIAMLHVLEELKKIFSFEIAILSPSGSSLTVKISFVLSG